MPNDRFFTSESLEEGKILLLKDEEHHHLAHVMRLKLDDTLEIINGKGFLALAKLTQLQKKQSLLHIESCKYFPPPTFKLKLAIGLPRFNRLEYLIEKGVELGIDTFLLFPANGSEKESLSENQWQRMEHLATSAIKQCGRVYLPEIIFMPHLCSCEKGQEKRFYGKVGAAPAFHQELFSHPSKEDRLFFIGPEKGFDEQEIAILENTLHAKGVSLSQEVLRVDTAAIAAAAFLGTLRLYS